MTQLDLQQKLEQAEAQNKKLSAAVVRIAEQRDAQERIAISNFECCSRLDAERDALQQQVNALAAETVVIPDGWRLVPVEPTKEMIIDGFESVPSENFSPPEVWKDYQSMSGCQQAAHRARLCWVAMLAAAPTA